MMTSRQWMATTVLALVAFVVGVLIGTGLPARLGTGDEAHVCVLSQHDRDALDAVGTVVDTLRSALQDSAKQWGRAPNDTLQLSGGSVDDRPRTPLVVGSDDRNGVKPGNAPTGWLAVLDPELGRVLVERALSPYSDGVSPHVIRAANSIRDAQAEFERASAPLKAMAVENPGTPNTELTRRFAQLNEALKRRREAAIGALIDALDSR